MMKITEITFLHLIMIIVCYLLALLIIPGKIVLASKPEDNSPIHLFIVGDSTACNYGRDRAPRAGWGQMFQQYFSEKVVVINEAASGRSSKSFIDEKRLEKVLSQIQAGDYLFIQFGHNDSKAEEARYTEPYTTYKDYLTMYIDGAREKGAIPVLLTPINRRKFGTDGKLHLTHGEYPQAMSQLGEELNVPVIDLTAKTRVYFEKLGADECKKVFLWLKPGEHPNYPNGIEDDTHLCEAGASQIARLVVEGIKEANLALAEYVNE